MKAIPTAIPDVLVIEPKVFGDERGFFFESYHRQAFKAATGLDVDFVQDKVGGAQRSIHHRQGRQAKGQGRAA